MNKEMEAARELALGDLRSRLTEPLRADERTIYRQAFEDGYNADASRLAEAVIEALGQCKYCRGSGKDWTRDFITMERKVIDCDGCKGTGRHPEAREYRRQYPAETAKGEENGSD